MLDFGKQAWDADDVKGLFFLNASNGPQLQHLGDGGLEIFDLETEVKAFNVQLPRLRIISLDEFDPLRYL